MSCKCFRHMSTQNPVGQWSRVQKAEPAVELQQMLIFVLQLIPVRCRRRGGGQTCCGIGDCRRERKANVLVVIESRKRRVGKWTMMSIDSIVEMSEIAKSLRCLRRRNLSNSEKVGPFEKKKFHKENCVSTFNQQRPGFPEEREDRWGKELENVTSIARRTFHGGFRIRQCETQI